MKYLCSMMCLVVSATTACGGSDDGDAADAGGVADAASAADSNVAAGPIRILPLGDSLTLGYGTATEGEGTEVGYRGHLLQLLGDAAIDVDFVGSRTNGPDTMSDRDHEGYNGYAVAQVAEVAGPAIEAYSPDIVILLAGTNDQIEFVPPSQPPAGAAADFEDLIEALDAQSPGIQIVAGQVLPLTFNDDGVREYNDLLPGIVERQRARGVNIRLVDHYAIGEGMLSNDGIHPTLAGYDAMADIWFPAVLEAIGEL